ncbi:MAG: hypothetical protein N2246_07510, partial [Candidatus Sumerlaeia bacterium]|nr:hypothetical protein [Candidatus Sumerlaeia bacterium]
PTPTSTPTPTPTRTPTPVPTLTPSPTPTLTPTFTPTPTPGWQQLVAYDFENSVQGWVFHQSSASAPEGAWTGAFPVYDSHRLGIETDDTTNRFGWWEASSVVPFVPHKLYKVVANLATNQENPLAVPTIRLRVNEENFSYAVSMGLFSNAVDFMPTTTNRQYNMYVFPVQTATGGLRLSFDVYDFANPGDSGAVYLDNLEVYVVDIPENGWVTETTPPFNSWLFSGSIPPFAPVASGTIGGLQLISGVGSNYNFSYWFSPAVIPWIDDQLYRVKFTVTSADVAPFNGQVRVNSEDYQVAFVLSWYLATAPLPAGRDYYLYFESIDYAPGKNHFLLSFDGADFESTQGGINTLTSVSIERHSLIP